MAETMTIDFARLAPYGWSHHFQTQIHQSEAGVPVRVAAVHRNALDVTGPDLSGRIRPFHGEDPEEEATVGDWLLAEPATGTPLRLLARRSVFRRKAAGTGRRVQLIAANVDTLIVVTSCNQDFNIARLERYLALAREAEVIPLVILTKADLVDDPAPFLDTARKSLRGVLVEALDARDPGEVASVLGPWCGPGATVALVGSSGVGKSTLVNALMGAAVQDTASIREDDSHGRHTTTGRSMHRLAAGGWLIDTPGMRELQLADAGTGIEAVFADVLDIARNCRFADCAHEAEPGCAVREAIADGRLDPERLRRYRKLAAEDARNSETIHARRARERGFGKMVKSIMKEKGEQRGG